MQRVFYKVVDHLDKKCARAAKVEVANHLDLHIVTLPGTSVGKGLDGLSHHLGRIDFFVGCGQTHQPRVGDLHVDLSVHVSNSGVQSARQMFDLLCGAGPV